MATLQERLEQAEAAYHDLMIGKAAIDLTDSNGERVRFYADSASRATLRAYIDDLKRQLGILTVSGPMRPMMTQPAGRYYGFGRWNGRQQ